VGFNSRYRLVIGLILKLLINFNVVSFADHLEAMNLDKMRLFESPSFLQVWEWRKAASNVVILAFLVIDGLKFICVVVVVSSQTTVLHTLAYRMYPGQIEGERIDGWSDFS
jgi:hypothetical protein